MALDLLDGKVVEDITQEVDIRIAGKTLNSCQTLAVLQDPGGADVQQVTTKERKANRSLGGADDLTDLSSSQMMMLAVRDDKGSYPDLFDKSSNRNGAFSKLKQPPPGDAGIPMPNMAIWDAQNCKHQYMDDLRIAQYTAKAHEDTTHILSPVETSNSAGRLPSDEISTTGIKGNVDADAGTNPRDEHVLLSYSKVIPISMLSSEKKEHECKYPVLQCSLNKDEAWLPAAGLNTASYADITMREIDDARANEPGISAALSSLQPITDEDRLATLGRSSCHDEIIGPPTLGSSHHFVLADPPGGEPRPCISIGKLRRNITDLRKQFDTP
ncbi:hypothetical protein Nepgr_032223 [Nepenthes gracilis]|uniref:Uncharacterized protein n=1 Tax=Nepenthes gracilis TaxID=150966 RepID=A0AAD3TI69_NEPGR|nr:hypothetical protein Nepgr_032223 [Nepenthes gracilis]